MKDKRVRGIVRDGIGYFALAMVCVGMANVVWVAVIWHDALLMMCGVFLGGVCAMGGLLYQRLEERKREKMWPVDGIAGQRDLMAKMLREMLVESGVIGKDDWPYGVELLNLVSDYMAMRK